MHIICGIIFGLVIFLIATSIIAISMHEDVFEVLITNFFIVIVIITIAFLVNLDGRPTNVKMTNVVAEKNVITATAEWKGQPPSKGSKHKVNITIVDPDGVVLKDHTFTVMYNGKKEFHLSIEVDESLTPFINNKTDKATIELEE